MTKVEEIRERLNNLRPDSWDEADRQFIANAPEDITFLLQRVEKLEEVLEKVVQRPVECQEIMRKNDLKIDNLEDKMQKLAFTFYTDLVDLSQQAEQALKDDGGGE